MKRLLTALLLAAALSGCMGAETEPRDTAREGSAAPRIETHIVDTLPPELCDPARYTLCWNGGALYAAEQTQKEGKSGHLRLLRWDPGAGECREVHTFSSGSWLLGLEAGEGELLLLTSRAEDTALTVLREGESPRSVPLPETDLLVPRLFAGQVIAGLPDGSAALLNGDGGLIRRLERSTGAHSIWLPADQAFFCLDTDSHRLTYSPEGELLGAEPLPDGASIRGWAALHGGRYELMWSGEAGALLRFVPDGGREAVSLGSGEGVLLHPGNGLLLLSRQRADGTRALSLCTGLRENGRPEFQPVDTRELGQLRRPAGIFPTQEGFLILGEWLTPEYDTVFGGLEVSADS